MNTQPSVVVTPTNNPQFSANEPNSMASSMNYQQNKTTDSSTNSGWIAMVVVVIIIIILVIVLAMVWSSNNNDDKSNKPTYCPRPRRKKSNMNNQPDMDDQPDEETSKPAVALLGLTGGDAASTKLDRDIATILEVYNAERPPDSRVLIRDTQGDVARTAALWEEALNEGHLRFIGGNSSNELTALKPAINSRPDSLFLSVASTAPSLAQRDNIFRLIKDDTQMLPAIPQFLANRYKYIHILQETGSIWADELSTLMQQALRNEGIDVGVTMVSGSQDISSNNLPIKKQSKPNKVCRTAQELDDNLSEIIPNEGDIAFLDMISSETVQDIFEQIDDSIWSQYKHYGFDPIITAPLTGKAASAANKTNLQVLSYWPQGTLESEAILRRAGIDNINPLAISVYDAVVSLERAGTNPLELENYYNSNRGVTGLLTVNPSNDRITNPYVLWDYNNGNWEPSVVFGKAIPYGDFLGRFGTLEELENDTDDQEDNYSPYGDCSPYGDYSPYEPSSCDNSYRGDYSPYSHDNQYSCKNSYRTYTNYKYPHNYNSQSNYYDSHNSYQTDNYRPYNNRYHYEGNYSDDSGRYSDYSGRYSDDSGRYGYDSGRYSYDSGRYSHGNEHYY